MASIFNAYVAYQFIKTLTTKWSDMDAFDWINKRQKLIINNTKKDLQW